MSARRAGWAPLLALGAVALALAATGRAGLLGFLLSRPEEVLRLLGQHLVLVLSSGSAAVALGTGLGIAVSRAPLRPLAPPVIFAAGLGQTVPSLAMLALIFALTGRIGFLPAFLALTLTSLLPIVRNTYQGLLAVDGALLEAGRGMGMRGHQILWRLELPVALGVIFAGIRTALVINVSAAALAFLIGGGGLGDLIFTGIDTQETGILVAGALPTIALALGLDWALARLQRRLTPRGLRRRG
jgi:osmoprotectant transport system permease protein